jgi:hypothetical protein
MPRALTVFGVSNIKDGSNPKLLTEILVIKSNGVHIAILTLWFKLKAISSHAIKRNNK